MFSTSEYSWDTHATSSWWSLLDLKTGKVTQLTNDSNVSELVWSGTSDSGLLYINGTNAEIPGGVEIWVSDTSSFAKSWVMIPQFRLFSLTFFQRLQGSLAPSTTVRPQDSNDQVW